MNLGSWLQADAFLRAAKVHQDALLQEKPTLPDDEDALANSASALAELELTRAIAVDGLSDWVLNVTSGNPWLVGRAAWSYAPALQDARGLAEQAIRIHEQLRKDHAAHPLYTKHLREDYGLLVAVLLAARDHAAAARAAERAVGLMTDVHVIAQEKVYAAQTLALLCVMARADPALTAAQRNECADTYARRAVELLKEALAGARSDLIGLESRAFDVLSGRDDFRALLRLKRD